MKALTDAQAKALRSARDTGNPAAHLRGRSEWGGFVWTQMALLKKFLLRRDGKPTAGGLRALADYDEKRGLEYMRRERAKQRRQGI